jgi:hypothetical protein
MGEVIRLSPRSQPRPISPTPALGIPVELCPACKGRGEFFFKNRFGCLDSDLCPCGGDDENRIGCDEPDFDGAA